MVPMPDGVETVAIEMRRPDPEAPTIVQLPGSGRNVTMTAPCPLRTSFAGPPRSRHWSPAPIATSAPASASADFDDDDRRRQARARAPWLIGHGSSGRCARHGAERSARSWAEGDLDARGSRCGPSAPRPCCGRRAGCGRSRTGGRGRSRRAAGASAVHSQTLPTTLCRPSALGSNASTGTVPAGPCGKSAAERVRAREGPLVAPRVARRRRRRGPRAPTRASVGSAHARPGAERQRVRVRDVHDGMVGRRRASRARPARASRRPGPPATTARSPARGSARSRPAGGRRRRTTSRRARPR